MFEVGRLKGHGREKEEKGEKKGREREGKGKGKVITLISAVSVRFETVSKYRNNRNKPKEMIIFFRKKYRNRTETASVSVCFGSNRKKKIRFAGHPT